MKVTANTRLNYRIQHIIFIILLLTCLGFGAWLSQTYNIRSDWTAGKRHSLSQNTIELLQQIPDDITVRSYQPEDALLSKAVTEILNRYKSRKSNFDFQLINPDVFIEQARKDNIKQYGQTIIEYQGRSERIEALTEESLTNALIRLSRNNQPRLLFISQHGERSINDNSPTGYSILAARLREKGFICENINLISETIPLKNTTLVMGTANKALLDSEQEKILQFIKSGGQMLWLQDPGKFDDNRINQQTDALADALNINFVPGIVVDDNQEVRLMLKLSHPAIIPVLEYKMHPITAHMQYFTLFTTARAIQEKALSSDWILSELLMTAGSSWSDTGDFLLGLEFNTDTDTIGPLSIGVALQRQLTQNKTQIAQRIVVIGDTDFLANNHIGQGANLDFMLKTANWLNQDDQLIRINPKNAPDLQLKLSATQASVMGIVFLIVIPVALLLTGGLIWYRRKKA